MKRIWKKYRAIGVVAVAALGMAGWSAAQGKQTFTGKITDDLCPTSDHGAMQMGPNDAECTVACVEAHVAAYALYDGEQTYRLSDQSKPKAFAGQKVTVTGTLDAKTSTIQVESIAAAK